MDCPVPDERAHRKSVELEIDSLIPLVQNLGPANSVIGKPVTV